MRTLTLEELLEAGCHFGHQVNRRNPKASEFIYEARANVHIINLEDTKHGLEKAADFLKEVAASGGRAILVGTKRQARSVVREESLRARKEGAENLLFVTSRWIGGTLTNIDEVSKNFKRLEELNDLLANPEKQGQYTKRELVLFEREKDKLKHFYEGILSMKDLPQTVIAIDIKHEETAVAEASKMDIPVVGVVDTNADPSSVSYSIPSNDDAVGAIQLIVSYLVDAWVEGEAKMKKTAEKKESAEKKTQEKKKKSESDKKSK